MQVQFNNMKNKLQWIHSCQNQQNQERLAMKWFATNAITEVILRKNVARTWRRNVTSAEVWTLGKNCRNKNMQQQVNVNEGLSIISEMMESEINVTTETMTDTTDWLIDSGATHHFTMKQMCWQSVNKYIRVSNGEVITPKAHGICELIGTAAWKSGCKFTTKKFSWTMCITCHKSHVIVSA